MSADIAKPASISLAGHFEGIAEALDQVRVETTLLARAPDTFAAIVALPAGAETAAAMQYHIFAAIKAARQMATAAASVTEVRQP